MQPRVSRLAFMLAAIIPTAALAVPGSILKIDTLGGNTSLATGINELGQVTGASTIASGNIYHLLFHDGTAAGVSQDLGIMDGSSGSLGSAINNLGDMAGGHRTGSRTGGFLYRAASGAFEDLGSFDAGADTYVMGLNDSGTTVGSSYSSSRQRAFLRPATPNAPLQDLGTLVGPNGDFAEARQINNAGTVVGSSRAATPGGGMSMHAFVYTAAGGMQDLGTLPGGAISHANGISENGIIVGESNTNGINNPPSRAFRLDRIGGVMNNLGVIGGNFSRAVGVNDSGMVIGESSTNTSGNNAVPALWTPAGLPVDLNVWLDQVNPIEGARWRIDYLTDINNAGLIVGYGSYASATEIVVRGFVIDASSFLPEPTSMFACLGVLISGSRRHR